jgi:hypothetical protein
MFAHAELGAGKEVREHMAAWTFESMLTLTKIYNLTKGVTCEWRKIKYA